MTTLSAEQVAGYAYAAGFRGNALVIATAVTGPESGRVVEKTHDNSDGSVDRGLWQINSKAHPQYDARRLLSDPLYNAQAAFAVSNGGNTFRPWVAFTNGDHIPYMAEATNAARSVESRGGIFTPATPGTGGTTPGVAQVLSPDVDPPPAPVIDLDRQPPMTWDDVNIEGISAAELSGGQIYQGSVDLTVDEVSQMELSFLDQHLQKYGESWVDLGVRVGVNDLDLAAGTVEVGDENGIENVTVLARSRAAEVLKAMQPGDLAQVSPTQALQQVCADPKVGLRFYGKGTGVGTATVDAEQQNPDGTKGQSMWEAATQWAVDNGFWFYEAAGTLWFAPPSWLVPRTTRVRVGWNGGWGDKRLDSERPPRCRRTRNPDGTVTVSITVWMPRGIGEQVRPGMGLELKGVDRGGVKGAIVPLPPAPLPPNVAAAVAAVVSGFDNRSNVGDIARRISALASFRPQVHVPFDGLYIVTKVHWEHDGGIGSVQVDAVQPLDPPVRDKDGNLISGGQPGLPGFSGSKQVADFVAFALQQTGKAYVWGGESDAEGGFDCSGLVVWALSQVGVTGFARTSQTQYQACQAANLLIPLDQGFRTKGALLFGSREGSGLPGHVAISMGDNRSTIEAKGRAYGVGQFSISGRSFYAAGLVPGLNYGGIGGALEWIAGATHQ